jgi:ubiquinone/menaquinone biosynthesis C-methylase UbiE
MSFDYEKKIWGGPEIKPSLFYIQGLKLKYLLMDLRDKKGKYLDIGCGAGNVVKAVKKERPDLDVCGVDISKSAITIAKKDSCGVKFAFGSTDKLPFRANTFDMVSMFDVLEHVDDEKAMREVARVLKKDGLFHLFIPLDGQPGTLYYIIRKLGWQPKDKHTGHLKVYSDKSVVKLVESTDFKLVEKRFSFHFLFSLFDIAFFSMLEIFHFKAPSSIEGMIEKKKTNPLISLFNLFYRMVVFMGSVESIILKNVPGGGGHFTLRKL